MKKKLATQIPNPQCTICHRNDRDTWPHLLTICEHPYLKGLRIARHNKAIHIITQTLQANKYTRFYTLIIACNLNNLEPIKNCLVMAYKMHMFTNKFSMLSQIKTIYLMHTRCPKPHTNTFTTDTYTHSTIH